MSTYSIASVERDTGLGKDTLRVWERRYGFPHPQRDAHGERLYSAEEVERLRLIKRLLDGGARPGKVVPLDMETLRGLERRPAPAASPRGRAPRQASTAQNAAAVGDRVSPQAPAGLEDALCLLRAHDSRGLRQALLSRLARMGLSSFVAEFVAPLNRQVGQAWMTGDLQVYEEHLYTEVIASVLSAALAQLPDSPGQPHVLLTTFVGESHGLGLQMAQCMLALEGCHCTSLGTQTPVADIARAASAARADIVALSFSPVLPAAKVRDGLRDLARLLPGGVQIWAGGSAAVLDRQPVEGVTRIAKLTEVATAVAAWRAGRNALPAASAGRA